MFGQRNCWCSLLLVAEMQERLARLLYHSERSEESVMSAHEPRRGHPVASSAIALLNQFCVTACGYDFFWRMAGFFDANTSRLLKPGVAPVPGYEAQVTGRFLARMPRRSEESLILSNEIHQSLARHAKGGVVWTGVDTAGLAIEALA